MKSWIPLLSPARNIDSLIAAAIGFCIIHLFTHYGGIGISPDSVEYISVARNIHAGKGMITFYGTAMVEFPCFYPIFLSCISFLTQLDTMSFATVLDELLFAMVLYTSGSLMNGFSMGSKWYKRIILSCLVLSPCLLEVYSMVWSETLFLLLIIFFIAAQNHYSRFYTINALLILSIITALACVTRYAGITVAGAGGFLILFDKNLVIRKKIKHLFIFGFISSSLLLINLARNAMAQGSFTGNRQKGITPIGQNIYFYGSVLRDWLPIPKNSDTALMIAGILALAIFSFSLLWLVIKKHNLQSYEKIAVVFTGVYSLFIILSSTFSRYEQINSRLLSPLFIPLIWSIGYGLLTLIKKSTGAAKKILIAVALLIAMAFQYDQWKADYETYDGVKDAGIPGYTEDPWSKSPTVKYLETNISLFQPGIPLYSNTCDAIYFYTGRSSFPIPQKAFPWEVDKFYAAKNHYLVWFDQTDNDALLTLPEILQHKKMTLIQQFTDGAVYLYQ